MHTLDIIFKELKNQNKTAKQLCEFLGLGKQACTDWKSGKSNSYKKYLPEIANYLNISIEYLCGKEEKPTGENTGELTEQEKILLNTFRSSSEEAKQRIIQSVLNIHDEYEKKNQAADSANAG